MLEVLGRGLDERTAPERAAAGTGAGRHRVDHQVERAEPLAGLRDGWAWAPREWNKVTDDTGTGDPAASTAQKGEKFLQAVTERISGFLVDLATADLRNMYE